MSRGPPKFSTGNDTYKYGISGRDNTGMSEAQQDVYDTLVRKGKTDADARSLSELYTKIGAENPPGVYPKDVMDKYNHVQNILFGSDMY